MTSAHSRGLARKALVASAFFVACIPAWAGECRALRADVTAIVARVHDGDTLRLDDGRNVRFIGINTPEVEHGDRRAEPLGDAARRFVERRLAADRTVSLQVGREPRDRYGRTLAHVFLADGTNLTEALLEAGLGAAVAITPNIALLDCYRAAETRARAARRGLWAGTGFAVIDADAVTPAANGFRLVRGTVVDVRETRNSTWINLAGGVGLRVAREDLDGFAGMDLRQWRGRQLIARGWLHPSRKGYMMQIHHPASIEFVP